MDISFDTIPVLICEAMILFVVYLFLYYKYIYSIIDPLFTWVFTTAFASVLSILVIPDLIDIIHFFGCQLALWFGFYTAYQSSNTKVKIVQKYTFSNQYILMITTYFFLIIYFTSNIILGYSKGFALLSDNPSTSKFANFQEGFGIFRKINGSLGTFTSTALIFMYFLERRTRDIMLLVIVILFSSLEGSKSALLNIAISAGIIVYHPAFLNNQIHLKKFQRHLPLIFIAVMSVFFVVLLKENEGVEESFLAFIRRLLYSADSVLYYYTPINLSYFEKYSFEEYFSRLVNPVLGFFRLQPYQEAIGNTLYDNLKPPGSLETTITVGPNLPFYMEGRIFFYYWLAFPYSMLVGYLYATIRIYFFSIKYASAFYFVFMGCFCHLAYAIVVDMNLAVTQVFDLFFFIIPVYIVISFILTGKLSIIVR